MHFDIHGKIGFLYFSDTESDGIKLVLGHIIGEFLEKFEVLFVVLNACEFARACPGINTNIT
jgi:hypothetical protein